jgi:hypothetical protein
MAPTLQPVTVCGASSDTSEVVSGRLPTVAARVQTKVTSCGNRGGQSGTGALQLPLPILIPTVSYFSVNLSLMLKLKCKVASELN